MQIFPELIPLANIARHVEQLAHIGNIGKSANDGFSRIAWSDEESAAFEYVRREAQNAGFSARYDAIGNLYLTLPGQWEHIVWTGSHLDSVPAGGNYDGVAGVIAGLEAIKAIHTSGLLLQKGVGLVLWRGEEGASFQQAYKGSLAAFGQLPATCLHHPVNSHISPTSNPLTLGDAIRNQCNPMTGTSFDPAPIVEGSPTLLLREQNRIAAFVELHIEQANKLEQDGDDIGIVTSIRGPARYAITLEHEAYHDIYLARILVALDQLANQALANGLDLVQTFGLINLQNMPPASELRHCAKTKVPGYAEVRLRASLQKFQPIIARIAEEFRVEIESERTQEGTLLQIYGAFDHSGATPMGASYRRDANLAAAYLLVRGYEQDKTIRASINYPKHNQGHFIIDIRSNQKTARDAYLEQVLAMIEELKSNFHLRGNTSQLMMSDPVEDLDLFIQEVIREACRSLGYRYQLMPSGAGHDAAIVAKQTHSDGTHIPVGMIFIPCRAGKSHCKEEFTTTEAILKGANVLAYTLYHLAR